MALRQLDPDQIRTWTLAQKDRWWLAHVWRGNEPQLTFRSALTGMALGGVLSLTNLYLGTKVPWAVGVGITSVILAFAFYKGLARLGLGREFTLLENVAMQSTATAAGYMTQPLLSSLAAYMLVTQVPIPILHTMLWMIAIALLGVLVAFPLKRRFINDEQLPFPEGRAAGVVMDALHNRDPGAGLAQARLLLVAAASAAVLKLAQSPVLLAKLKLGFLAIPEYLDAWIYRRTTLRIQGIDLRELTVRWDSDFVLMATGGLMGIRIGVSLLVGAVVNYLLVVPWAIHAGEIVGQAGPDGTLRYGFGVIARWALWGGVALMTASSLTAFFARPGVITSAFRGWFRPRSAAPTDDPLRPIELPMRVFVLGIPLVGGVVVLLAHLFFGVKIWLGIVAIPLVFAFALIAVNATALTSIIPTGAMGKLTQLGYGVLDPGNIKTNLMTAGITAEVAANASNLLSDIKPGYMLGAKPRQQAIGHVLGIFAGAFVAVPVFYLVLLHAGPTAMFEQHPLPAARIWHAFAELLTQGLANLNPSTRWAALIGALLGFALESARLLTRGRFWLSGVAVGLAAVIPFHTCFSMFLGSLIVWLAGRRARRRAGTGETAVTSSHETVCGGLIAGGALMGLAVMVLELALAPSP
ncbi:MAG: OPT/YSL family transporter [Verrucomicrobiales bacterium]|nr:OPT/YSL family transporter [Verrucomicrobiales bacterium]